MGSGLTSGYRYRHVVFTTPPARPALNLGRAHTTSSTPPTISTFRATPTGDDTPDACESDHDAFFAWIFLEAGLSARHYRPTSLRRRLPACLRALRVDDVSQARRLLRRHPQFVPVAVGALLLGVTEFFRDAGVFEAIERELPAVLRAAAVDDNRPVRVWSAGCSDGAELYSVAMLLARLDALHRCDLLGTDCRQEAIATATKGVFGPPGLRGLPPAMIERYVSPVDPSHDVASAECARLHQIDARLRGAVRWLKADLLAGPQPGPWDLVLCRNMAMYLQPLAAERLWRGIVSSLRPGGMLVLGKAERPCPSVAGELSAVAPCVYRRRYGAL
jgi:chemotaxis methyl-accepting protein methylase